jgi:glucokinase
MVSDTGRADEYILAGDVGGTNTNLAIVERRGKRFRVAADVSVDSQGVSEFTKTVQDALAGFGSDLTPGRCCISAAGPVEEGRCQPTNLNWIIDGKALRRILGIPTIVINDFLALSYSLPLLDTSDSSQVIPLPHPDGSIPRPEGCSYAIIGAGTGLGVGHLVYTGGRFVAVPSEGGHSDFPAFDKETQRLGNYLKVRFDSWPGTECVLSGQGISNIYSFVRSSLSGPVDIILQEIDSLPDRAKPALIAANGTTNPHCRRVMELFTRIYGKFAGNTALNFLPEAGLFLAGGIAQKNSHYLLEEQRFMRYFESNYHHKLRDLQHRIPVYLIKEYSVSLLGAAHAATLLGTEE